MPLLIVFLPLVNFFKFALLGTKVHRRQLSLFTVAGMGLLLTSILFIAPAVTAGTTQITSLGV